MASFQHKHKRKEKAFHYAADIPYEKYNAECM